MHALPVFFTGRRCHIYVDESPSTLCGSGFSAFSGILTPSHRETKGDVGKIHFVPGKICFEGKSYVRLVDERSEVPNSFMAKGESLVPSTFILSVEISNAARTLSVREGSTTSRKLERPSWSNGARFTIELPELLAPQRRQRWSQRSQRTRSRRAAGSQRIAIDVMFLRGLGSDSPLNCYPTNRRPPT